MRLSCGGVRSEVRRSGDVRRLLGIPFPTWGAPFASNRVHRKKTNGEPFATLRGHSLGRQSQEAFASPRGSANLPCPGSGQAPSGIRHRAGCGQLLRANASSRWLANGVAPWVIHRRHVGAPTVSPFARHGRRTDSHLSNEILTARSRERGLARMCSTTRRTALPRRSAPSACS